jgi:hypothetical protein
LVLIGLFVLLAANLWGFFEVGGRWVGAAAERGRSWGAFGSGVLATVVATPCTAPFMGTAIGVALAQPVPAALAVFTSLALGMAFPYWLLTVVPAAGRWLPRPGPWMNRVKMVLGFFLLATAGWLLWVLYQQSPAATGPAAALGAALGVARVLERRESVAILADRPFGEVGETVSLCGRPARLPRGPFLFAARSGAPLVPGFVLMEGPGRYRVVVEDPIWPTGKGHAAVQILLDKMAQVLGKYLAQHAEQWYCFEPVWEGS